MIRQPTALDLWVCEQVIHDSKTGNPSLINCFTGRVFPAFPTDRIPFSVFSSLTDSEGTGRIELAVLQLETRDCVYQERQDIVFPDRLRIVNVDFRVRRLRFPSEGVYSFVILVDGELIAERKLRVYQGDPEP